MPKAVKILIMGRANVGKSTLVNRILGENRAITLDYPGVTRDLTSYPFNWKGYDLELIDSGGVLFEKADDIQLQAAIDDKVRSAIEDSDVICLLTDGKVGVMPLDDQIARVLRPYKDKTKVLVNKVDDKGSASMALPFHRLGLGDPIAISALNNMAVPDLLKEIAEAHGQKKQLQPTHKKVEGEFTVSLLGRPNVGKSSLVNAILNENLLLVENKAGTTRDAVPLHFTHHGQKYVFVDTAGVRKQSKVNDGIEYYAVLRSKKSMEDADLVIFVTDPEEVMCEQDRKLIHQVMEAKRNMIVFINKWDTTQRTDEARKVLIKHAQRTFAPLSHYPVLTGSATEKLNLHKLMELIPETIQQGARRIPTAALNQFIEQVIRYNPPPSKKGERVKIYYMTQVDVSPPTFVIFINRPKNLPESYKRFLENRLREAFPFVGNTIDLQFRMKAKRLD